MKVENKLTLKIENLEKCCVVLDQECPLGQLYDFSCALKSFTFQKMKELEDQENQSKKEITTPEA
jgi:hypothetical protein